MAPRHMQQRLLRLIGRLTVLGDVEFDELDLFHLEAMVDRLDRRVGLAGDCCGDDCGETPGTPSTGTFCCNSEASSEASWDWAPDSLDALPKEWTGSCLLAEVSRAAAEGTSSAPPGAPQVHTEAASRGETEFDTTDGGRLVATAQSVDVDIIVPEGVGEEDLVTVGYEGLQYEVRVPVGNKPGSTFRIALSYPPPSW
mmetsp:Transcript_50019/g.140208  ORF Transcript_50019/g.140208 Transcript_50019/m.140208 type:complete len:198 (-) Transcript_50019:113-706(-)|eukprot:CAMPEP_0117591014 /NCGR_PEP_ID=MMETSP0784-20121206/71292_1 /TAXON_ID=39447 /ORGANISM="" /LENGTH=197 /DNA_ID=CAMNT_0005392679 /DNA_START=57 /DNA_END=650 /DNA_ORIENTATION=+